MLMHVVQRNFVGKKKLGVADTARYEFLSRKENPRVILLDLFLNFTNRRGNFTFPSIGDFKGCLMSL